MKMKSTVLFLSLSFSVFVPSQWAWADDVSLSFVKIWQAVEASSPTKKAGDAGYEAARIASERSGRHWFPKVFLNARAYETNDPAQTFFGLLGERQVSASDFSPNSLNSPGSSFFTQAGVGIDLPLYEGGLKSTEYEVLKSIAQSKSYAAEILRNEDYFKCAQYYGGLLALSTEVRQLNEIWKSIDVTIQTYKLGSRANPIGYSGLLGLKGLRNRVQVAISQNQEQSTGYRESLSEMAKTLPEGWQVGQQEFIAFVNGTLSPSQVEGKEPSFMMKSARAMAESQQKAVEGEKARFLPKVGLFAEEDLNSGSRGSGTSYSTGAYVQWNIFSATDYGAVHEAQLRSEEASATADARALEERMQRSQARHTEVAAEQAIRILNDSIGLLAEQTEESKKLYQSGAINALQFLEILSRRVDLISSLSHAQLELLDSRISVLRTSDFEVPLE